MPPPREPYNPQNRGRRRQESMPGGWLWLIILLLAFFVLYFTFAHTGGGNIDYTVFLSLAEQGKFKRVILQGENRAIGILNESQVNSLPDEVAKNVRNDRVETKVPNAGEMTKKLTELVEKQQREGKTPFTFAKEDEPGGWVGPLVMMLLPAAI